MERLLRTLSDDARAALFGFAVESALCPRLPEDVAEAFTAHRYEDFAAAAGRDAVVLKSIKDRPAADYWDPSKRSAAYKFAAEYFADRS